jgi:MarR family transcriptional regulator, lower aerobic nicotinate degradation pathway regulator
MVRGMKKPARNRILWSRPGFLARRLHQINVAIFLAEFDQWRLTPNQWGVLTVAASSPGLSHTEIAVQCGIDRVNVRDIVIRLEDRGLMRQKRSTEDRRQSCAFITAYGKTLLRELEPNVRRAHEILLSPLGSEDKEIFLTLLRRLVDENNELSRAPLPLNLASLKERKENRTRRR